jgi:hypothetical protein
MIPFFLCFRADGFFSRFLLGAICSVGLFCFSGCSLTDRELQSSMQSYLSAMKSGDIPGFVNLVTQEKSFRFSSYDGATGNLIGAATLSRSELLAKLRQQGGLWFALFDGTAEYRYRDRLAKAPLSSWREKFSVYRWEQGKYKSYVRWNKEAQGWKIIEIGDTVP